MTLTILIPTLNEPHYITRLKRLQSILDPQVEKFKDRVVVRYNDKGRSMTIGEKRNIMMESVDTEYSVFIDSDDVISTDYLHLIMSAIDKGPDCVTFNGSYTCNGVGRQKFVIKLGELYEERNKVFYRWPNHLVPMRTELVRHIKFPHVVKGEDYAWSKIINDRKLLKTSLHINEDIYWYQFETNKPPYGSPTAIRH